MLKITGTIRRVFETNEVSMDKHYREFWIITDEDNPQWVRLQMQGVMCTLLDTIKEGSEVEVEFRFAGRPKERNGKFELYTNANVKSIKRIE